MVLDGAFLSKRICSHFLAFSLISIFSMSGRKESDAYIPFADMKTMPGEDNWLLTKLFGKRATDAVLEYVF